MVNIDNKQAYYADSMAKELTIEVESDKKDYGGLNFYTGDFAEYGIGTWTTYTGSGQMAILPVNKDPRMTEYPEAFDITYLKTAEWWRIGLCLNISEPEDIDGTFGVEVLFEHKNGKKYVIYSQYINQPLNATNYRQDAPAYLDIQNHTVPFAAGGTVDFADVVKILGFRMGNFSAANKGELRIKFGISRYFMHFYSEKPEPMKISDYVRSYKDLGINPEDVIKSNIPDITNSNLIAESFNLTESLCSADKVKFGLCEAAHCSFEIAGRNEDFNDLIIKPKIKIKGEEGTEVPLGRFKVESSKANYVYDVKKTKITAYDLLAKTMEENAFNWYTSYMTAYSTDNYTRRYGFEVARQVYSSYFNVAKQLGLEDRNNYSETVIFEETAPHIYTADSVFRWFPIGTAHYDAPSVQFEAYEINFAGMASKPNRLVVDLEAKYTPQDMKQRMPRMYSCEPLGRGITSGNIYIKEYDSTGEINSFCVDSGDYFMVSPNAEKIRVYFANSIDDGSSATQVSYAGNIKVSVVNDQIDLTNGWIRLMYYNFSTQEIFSIDTTVTARDVIRSLIEVTGAFFKMDRSGRPAFLYADKAGLYPSNHLYPSENLYPLKADFMQASMGHYMTFEYENYSVLNFGKIQIVKKDVDNSSKSLVQWEYKGSDSKNTYLIDDNIFYSNPDLEYEFDSMPEVSEMLENMYIRIANLTYIPHYTKAIGLPFMETGDRLLLLTKTGGIESFIFRRTLTGINSLQDKYEAEGVQYTKEISDYAYKEWRE